MKTILDEHIKLWNHLSVSIMDVRHRRMELGEHLSYQLPSSAYIYTVRGSAEIGWNGTVQQVSRFHVLHGGKGLRLDIAAGDFFEFYMILYKAVLPLPCRQELLKLMENNNPGQTQFAFMPANPLVLLEKATRMDAAWQQSLSLDRLHVKTLFYQWVYEITGQLSRLGIQPVKPDPVEVAVRYIEEYYKEPITLEALAERLDCHSRQFLRKFKSQKNKSPIEYLIRVRMHKAKELLLNTDGTVKEIAECVGYSDRYYFSRMFKKITGISPAAFREAAAGQDSSRNNPSLMSLSPIAAKRVHRYIVNEHENHYQYNRRGEIPMYRKSGTSLAVTLLFCLTLVLSACTSNAPANSSTSNGSSAGAGTAAEAVSPTTSPAQASGDTEATRVIKHAMGEETLTGTPERVVILTNEGTEALLTLGVKPVGAVMSWDGDPWYDHIKDDMQDVTVVGDELQPNIELIASLKPDLIIGNKVRQEKIYEQLKQIAPTVFSEDLAGDWKINFKLYSEALNKKAEGEQAMQAFDERVAEVKSKLGSIADTKVSIVRFSASQVRIYQKQSFSGVLFDQLGFARPASQDKDNFMEVMSKETIPSMDGDVMFYFVTEAAGKSDASKVVQEWLNDPLFKNLNVSKNNKVVEVNEAIWNTAGGYEAANLLLDEIVKYFDVK